MKIRTFPALVSTITIPASASAQTDTTAMIEAARPVADSMVALVDAGALEASWHLFRSDFRAQVSQEQIASGIGQALDRFGPLTNRSLASTTYTTELPNALPGEYVVIVYSSTGKNGRGMLETVSLVHETDGSWAVDGYGMRPSSE